MKKFIIGFIAGAILFGALGAVAAVGLRDVRVADTVSLWVHGRRVETDIIHAVRYDNPYGFGRNYVSARDLAEALGYFVDWCGDTNRILVDRVPPVTAAQATHALVGTWAWDGNDAWRYTLNPDGTGTRGILGDIQAIDWRASEAGHLLIYIDNFMYFESWSYAIRVNGTRLTIDSRQVDDLTHSYTRLGGQALPQPPAHGLSAFYPENSAVPRFGYFLGRSHFERNVWNDGTLAYWYEIGADYMAWYPFMDALYEAGFELGTVNEGYNSTDISFWLGDTLLMVFAYTNEGEFLVTFNPQ